jgi:hypothetical protein
MSSESLRSSDNAFMRLLTASMRTGVNDIFLLNRAALLELRGDSGARGFPEGVKQPKSFFSKGPV